MTLLHQGQEVDRVMSYFGLRKIAVAKDEWQIENGFLTPTMKIKRNILEDTYAPKLDQWYEAGEPVVWEA